MSATMSTEAQNFSWLLSSFVRDTAGVRYAIGVSSDGLLMAVSDGLDRAVADQFAAITSGMTSLAQGAARCFSCNEVEQVIVELDDGFLFVARISDGSSLGVLAEKSCDIGLIGYEMTMMVERVGGVLTPDLIQELRGNLAS